MTMTVAAPNAVASPTLPLFQPILRDLEAVERVYFDTLRQAQPHLHQLFEHLNKYRGKRLRPMLLLTAAKACGDVGDAHHILGAVVEMIHTATLVHDDVLDEAGTRRYIPTVNANWGNKASILLGDFLFTHAFHLTSTLGDAKACELIGEATNRVCEGEMRQTFERGNLELSEDDYLEIIEGKTAALTSCCCQLGAMYASAESSVVSRLAEFGRLLGMAFQVADDLLDVVGSETKVGKTLGTDLDQQKLTLPVILMLDRLSDSDATRARSLLRTSGFQSRRALMPLLEETGALADARTRAELFASSAADQIAGLPQSDALSSLHRMTDWVVARDK